jgi:parallel beta-helix repeat protein
MAYKSWAKFLCAALLVKVSGAAMAGDQFAFSGLANPAAVYSQELGYRHEINEDGQGIVVFPDGSTCDEWDFYRGKCKQEWSFAGKKGYQVKEPGRHDGWLKGAVLIDKRSNKEVGTVYDLMKLQEKITAAAPEVALPESDGQQLAVGAESVSMPTAFDWHTLGGQDWLSPVKNQGSCGSCWAFSACGTVEGQFNVTTGNPGLDLDLAEQYLISCTSAGTCSGGWPSSSFAAMISGIPDEACFPYKAMNAPCSLCSNWSSRLSRLNSYGYVQASASAIKNYLYTVGPLSVCIRWGDIYSDNGMLRCTVDGPINHAIVMTGFDDVQGCWIIKNSWGSTWNGDGYARFAYGECSIEAYCYGVTVKTAATTQAINPLPQSGQTGVALDAHLSWTAGSGTTSHNVYFGSSNPPAFAASQTSTGFTPPALTAATTYYWRVDEVGASGTVAGTLWSFTTMAPPGKASSPYPADGATGVKGAILSFKPGTEALSHDVYFGAVSPGAFVANQTGSTFNPGQLEPNTTYYWRIDEHNALGSTVGDVWSFTSSDGYYVDAVNGNDSNPGTSALPWLTMIKAAKTLVAGDTVHVRPGVYKGMASTSNGGAAGKPISYLADRESGPVVLDAAGKTDAFLNQKPYIVFDGFTVINASGAGVYFKSDTGDNCIIRNVSAHHNKGPGIRVSSADSMIIENCLVYSNVQGGIVLDNDADGGIVKNCTVYGNTLYGMKFDKSDTVVRDSIIAKNSSWGIYALNTVVVQVGFSDVWGNVTGSYSSYVLIKPDGTCLGLDPLLVNPAAANFDLDASSPCAGTASDGGSMGYRD